MQTLLASFAFIHHLVHYPIMPTQNLVFDFVNAIHSNDDTDTAIVHLLQMCTLPCHLLS